MSTLPRGATGHQALYHHRERLDLAQVLVLGLPQVCAQGAMHHRRLSAHCAGGTRGHPRGDAAAAGSATRDDASTTTNGRASVRNDQVLDGVDPLPDEDPGARTHRDESARPGLYPET